MAIDVTALSIEVRSTGVKEASNALGGLSTSAANAEKRVQALVAATDKLQQSSIASATAMQTYVAKLQQQATLLQSMSTSSAQAAAGTQSLAAAMALLAASLNTLNQNTQNATRAQAQHNSGMRDAQGLARGLSGGLGALWLSYSAMTGTAVGLGIAVALKSIVSVGKDVENTLEGIRVRGEESVDSINKMRDAVADLGKGVYGPKEVANAFDVLILAGLRADQALIGIKDALNLATVGGTTIEKSATVLVQVSTALGYTAEGFGRISDVIAKTAAVSISSVDGISESFKSASVVGKLYGQSLVDLGTQFAILSNLGIKNSAAGTAAKNFFSDLASGSDKVTRGLSMLKLTIQDLQDKQGNFKSFNEVLRTLAGDTEKGFNSLTAASQKYVQTLITNERGNKLMTEGLDLIRQKGKETATALDDISKSINESWGFTAQGAAAMALTIDAQFKSVKNTLQTQLGAAFVEIQPQLSLVATRLKAAFNSPEFLTGVQSLATGVANMTVFVVENAGALWEVVRALLAFKAVMMIIGVITGIAEAFRVMTAALTAARGAALLFQASLGLVGIALSAGAALMVYWATKRDEAFGTKQQAALNYMDDFKGKLDEENTRLAKQIDLMNKGKTATEAFTQAQQQLQLQKVKEQGANAIGDAQTNLNKTWAGFNNNQRQGVDSWMAGNHDVDKYDGQQLTALKAYSKAANDLLKVKAEVAKKENETQKSLEKNVALSKQAAEVAEAQAKARNVTPEGVGTIPKDVDKAAVADAFQAQLAAYQNQIKAAKRVLDQTKSDAQSQYMQGLIGERGLIEANYNAEKSMAEKAIGFIQQKIDAAKGAENKKALATKFQGDLDAQQDALEAAAATRKNKYAEDEVNNQRLIQKALQEKFTSEGKFTQAYEAEFKKKHDVQISGMLADINAEKDAVKKAEGEKIVAILNEQYEAGVAHAKNKESLASFMELANATRNALKGVQTGSEGQGLAAMFEAAQIASQKFADSLPELRARMSNLTDPAAINEAQAQLTNLGESQRKLWAGVGESIGKSLESAFGKSGKAAGDLIKIGQNYANLEQKSDSARIKAYGDAAGAAKGFFKEGTKGYEIMAGAEKAFRVIELAGQAKSLATTITNAMATASAWSPAVVMAYMAEMGPFGWAAAAGAIAALGVAFSGGSGSTVAVDRQKTQGTGSVLGASDAKSESIVNSLSILEKNSGLGLAHNNTMIHYLKSVSDNIGNLATAVVQKTGISGTKVAGVTEGLTSIFSSIPLIGGLLSKLFGSTTTVLDQGFTANRTTLGQAQQSGINASQYADVNTKKSFFGFTYSNNTDRSMTNMGADVNNQIKLVIDGMAQTITEAAKSLGMGGDAFTQHLKTFVIDIGNISVKGLSGTEIEKAFSAVFSKLGDDMAMFALGGLAQYQKANEGLLETVSRLANDLIQVKDVFAVLGKTFNLTGVAAITVSESLISASGGLDKLTTGAKFFVDNFLTESEKMGPIAASVQTEMDRLGMSSVTTIEQFSKVVRSLDLTDPAAQALYASLMDVAPAFKDAADYATKLAEGTVTLTKAQQKALDAVNKAKSNLQDAYNSESSALQGTIDKTKAFVLTLKNYQDSLKLGADSPLTNMQKYAEAKKQFDATALAAQGGDQAAKDKFVSASTALLAASKVINASGSGYTSDFNMVQTMIDSLIGTAGKEVNVAQASLDALNKQVAGLIDINKSVLSVTDAIIALQNAIVLGGASGLSNTQMGTTYTPTAQQVAAATPQASTGALAVTQSAGVVAAIEANTAAVVAQTAAQAAQTGAVVGAVYDSSDANAATIADAYGAHKKYGQYEVAFV